MKWINVYKNGMKVDRESTCFQSLPLANTDIAELHYKCFISAKLTLEMVNFYIAFLRSFLTVAKWTAEIDKEKSMVVFKFTPTYDYYRDLFYMTAFRYIEQFPLFVERLYNNNVEMTDEQIKAFDVEETRENALLRFFQRMHIDAGQNKDAALNVYQSAIGSYGLIYNAGSYDRECSYSIKKPISIQQLQKNLSVDKRSGVFSYWTTLTPL